MVSMGSRQGGTNAAHSLRTINDSACVRLQVAAVAALMEAVRGWEDSGTFNAQLFDDMFESLCCQNTSAEAVSFFISTYLECPDVRCVELHKVTLHQLTVLWPSLAKCLLCSGLDGVRALSAKRVL